MITRIEVRFLHTSVTVLTCRRAVLAVSYLLSRPRGCKSGFYSQPPLSAFLSISCVSPPAVYYGPKENLLGFQSWSIASWLVKRWRWRDEEIEFTPFGKFERCSTPFVLVQFGISYLIFFYDGIRYVYVTFENFLSPNFESAWQSHMFLISHFYIHFQESMVKWIKLLNSFLYMLYICCHIILDSFDLYNIIWKEKYFLFKELKFFESSY